VIEPALSRDHSERMLRAFGADLESDPAAAEGPKVVLRPGRRLQGQTVVVPGDISSAAFWLVAAQLAPGSEVVVENVGLNPSRTGILDVLQAMGARVEVLAEREVAGEPVGDLRAWAGPLQAFSIGGELIPRLVDEIPVLAVAALAAEGTSVIRDAAELRVKETDRLAVMARQLRLLGAMVEETDDGLVIPGNQALRGAAVASVTDHRVAMSLAVAALVATGSTTVDGSEAAAVSYPTFWDDLARLGG
jgi:3-phosphoshikimate 1-carboxyvinyltransferase